MSDDEILDRVRTFAKRGNRDRATSSKPEDGGTSAQGEVQMPEEGQAVEQPAAEEIASAPESRPSHTGANGHALVGGALAAAADVRPCPIPSGSVIFGELTSAFVDGPRLLRFLGDRRHTGAVVDAGGDRVQVAILHEGDVLAMVSTAGGAARRLDGIHLPAPGSSAADEHQLTVLTYRPEVAVALGQLVNLPERFERMHGSFVDFPALLSFLKRESANGAVRVATHEDTGVVLLRNGNPLGAYTARKPELEDPDTLFDLAKASDAEIDVHVGALQVPPPAVPVAQVVR